MISGWHSQCDKQMTSKKITLKPHNPIHPGWTRELESFKATNLYLSTIVGWLNLFWKPFSLTANSNIYLPRFTQGLGLVIQIWSAWNLEKAMRSTKWCLSRGLQVKNKKCGTGLRIKCAAHFVHNCDLCRAVRSPKMKKTPAVLDDRLSRLIGTCQSGSEAGALNSEGSWKHHKNWTTPKRFLAKRNQAPARKTLFNQLKIKETLITQSSLWQQNCSAAPSVVLWRHNFRESWGMSLSNFINQFRCLKLFFRLGEKLIKCQFPNSSFMFFRNSRWRQIFPLWGISWYHLQGRSLDLSICTSWSLPLHASDSGPYPYDIHLCAKVNCWCSSIWSWTLLICTNPNQTWCKHSRCNYSVA